MPNPRLDGVFIMALSSIFGGFARGSAELPKATTDLQAHKDAKPGDMHTAIVAGGCFWCVEGVFEQFNGVKEAVSGYAGGTKETATYEQVCSATTGHAEAVKITYDPSKLTYGDILRIFFSSHDPTTKDRQGPDSGPQYRSAIFYETDDQKKVAEAYIQQLNAAKAFPRPIVTALEPLKPDAFYVAEDYHQNYAACHLSNPYILHIALPKIEKAREKFNDQVKPEEPGKP